MAWTCAHQLFAWLFSHAAHLERPHDHFPLCDPYKRPPVLTPSVTIHPIYHRCGLAFWVLNTRRGMAPPDRTIRPPDHNPIPHPAMTISAALKLTNGLCGTGQVFKITPAFRHY